MDNNKVLAVAGIGLAAAAIAIAVTKKPASAGGGGGGGDGGGGGGGTPTKPSWWPDSYAFPPSWWMSSNNGESVLIEDIVGSQNNTWISPSLLSVFLYPAGDWAIVP